MKRHLSHRLTPRQIIERNQREAQRQRDLHAIVERRAVQRVTLPHTEVFDIRCPYGPHLCSFLTQRFGPGYPGFVCRHCLLLAGAMESHFLDTSRPALSLVNN